MPSTVCDVCQQELEVGDFPFCPHGRGMSNAITDDVPGGFWAENGFPDGQPRKFYSKSEHVRALAQEGCEIRAKWAGPGDQHLKRWDAVSQHTLDAAKAMLSRPRSPRSSEGSC